MKRTFLFLLSFLVLNSLALSKDFSLSGHTEVGQRSTSEDYLEEDDDDDYDYLNSHVRIKRKVSPLHSYDFSGFLYQKDYVSRDSLDNTAKVVKAGWSQFLNKSGQSSLKLDYKFRYREKRFRSAPKSEYNQVFGSPKLTYEKKDLFTASLSAGADDFNYLEGDVKDQLKVFGNISGKGYLLEKRLMLTSGYKIETTEQSKVDRKRTKHDYSGGFDVRFGIPWISLFRARGNWGQRDTKEIDGRDEDADFEHWRASVRTEHKLHPKLKTHLKYQYFGKDYISSDLDHSGFYVQNGWDYEVLKDSRNRFWLNLDAGFKELDYPLKSDRNYKKETVEAKATFRRKGSWKARAAFEGNFYDFSNPANDRKRYYGLISGEKSLLGKDLVLSLAFKYRFTDHDRKVDTRQEAIRFEFTYKF